MKKTTLALSLSAALLSSSLFAHEGHEHPPVTTTPTPAPTPVTPTPTPSPAPNNGHEKGHEHEGEEEQTNEQDYSEFAAHLAFESKGVHAHAYWKKLPAVDVEAFLQLEFRDAATHEIVTPVDLPSVSVWNSAYGYGLVQPSIETALDKDGDAIPGTYNVSSIYFLATGQWEVRVYLTDINGEETKEFFNVDLGELAPNPNNDPNSAVSGMHGGMDMGTGAKPAEGDKPTDPETPAPDHSGHSGHN